MKGAVQSSGGPEPTAVALIEEAVHLLRRAPAGAWAIYCAGAVPWVLGLLFFWAEAAWARVTDGALLAGALGLGVLFVALKTAQAEFCARLLALRLGVAPAAGNWRRIGRLAAAQLRLQPWVLLALAPAPAALLAAPLGWLYAYGQSATALGDEARLHDEAVAEGWRWPGQNHLGLLLLGAVALCAAVNLGAAFYAVPWLANRVLGIETVFSFSGWAFMNTTFLAAVAALAWLAVDPLVKAFYTLRVFHGRARSTGEDLRVEWRRARLRAAALLCFLTLAAVCPGLRGTEAVAPARLDRTIDAVLAGEDFQWRAPEAVVTVAPESGNEAAWQRWVRQSAATARENVAVTFRVRASMATTVALSWSES